MTLGVVMLVHTALHRAEQAIRHWTAGGCPVVVHVDKRVDANTYNAFVSNLADLDQVLFCERHLCNWGGWGIVAGTQSAATLLLDRFPDVNYVYLASGACLPLRPVKALQSYLNANSTTDFIESARTEQVPWIIGGLAKERFTLRFPFSWKKHRRLFDWYVKFQQRIGFRRAIPAGLEPHMGSQWWCLTKATLLAILNDPRRAEYDKYFRKVWIPDESYFQTLARLHTPNIESRSLTLSKFDFQGKPHVFYDDHLPLLRRSGGFVARKIWPDATAIYAAFPNADAVDPDPNAIDRVFTKAIERRTLGRPGLYMQGRFPKPDRENGLTAQPYTVLQGFAEVIDGFAPWLAGTTGARVHGHLYAKDRVYFDADQTVFKGGLSESAALRDYNAQMFLTSLIWNTRGEHQCFQFGPPDTQDISWMIAKDTNAHIAVISGGWIVPLFRSGRSAAEVRQEAACLQQIEHAHLKILRSPYARAQIRIWTLAEFVASPMDVLQDMVDGVSGETKRQLMSLPKLVDLKGLGAFLQDLRNAGMHPYVTGNFPVDDAPTVPKPAAPKSYRARQ